MSIDLRRMKMRVDEKCDHRMFERLGTRGGFEKVTVLVTGRVWVLEN